MGSSGSLTKVYVVPGWLYGSNGHGMWFTISNSPSEGSTSTLTFSSTWSLSVLVQSNCEWKSGKNKNGIDTILNLSNGTHECSRQNRSYSAREQHRTGVLYLMTTVAHMDPSR